MLRFILVLLVFAALAPSSFAKVKRRTHHRSTHRRVTTLRSQGTAKARMAAGRSGGSALRPTTDRYREIQQALAAKGYYQGEADGKWNPSSVEALKRFQGDQNLAADGSLNSLSLIALGLGPKRTVAASAGAQQ